MYATIELDKFGYQDLPKEFDPEGEGLVYGQNLGQCDGWDELDAIAKAAGANAISSYLHSSEMSEDFDDEELPPEAANWSPINEGKKTFQALVNAVKGRSPNARIGQYAAEDVLWDLQICLSILTNAKSPNEYFRIDVA